MKKEHLGELEELVLLLIVMLKEGAYGFSVRKGLKDHANRTMSIGSVHGTINRLESKGLIKSVLGEATEVRGGRRKRMLTITAAGMKSLQKSRDVKVHLWAQIPELSF